EGNVARMYGGAISEIPIRPQPITSDQYVSTRAYVIFAFSSPSDPRTCCAYAAHAVWNAPMTIAIAIDTRAAAEYEPSASWLTSCCTCIRSARLSAHSAMFAGISGTE